MASPAVCKLDAQEGEETGLLWQGCVQVKAPNMWLKESVGLYCQYAAAGLLYGSAGTLQPFCVYVYKGDPNVCSNSSNIAFFAWNCKLIFAIIVDCWHPFGLRRKSWMLIGFTLVLMLLFMLALFCDQLTTSEWLATMLLMQLCLMFSTVPADGYSIELGELEPLAQKGKILITGQRIFFIFCMVAGAIQSLLLNGPSTNPQDCDISFNSCWSWGLTPKQYYSLLFGIVLCLTGPMLFLRERKPTVSAPPHSIAGLMKAIWLIMHNLTTIYILIFVIGIGALTNFTSQVNNYLQYYVIILTNFEAGIDSTSTYACLVLAIYIFQTYLMNTNWRTTQYFAVIFSAILGLLWIPAYYNFSGTRTAWYTIFVDLDQSFVNGLTQVIYSLAVMELAKPGQEATTFELVATVGNAACAMSGIFATQLLGPLKCIGCTLASNSTHNCTLDVVDLNSISAYESSNGPQRFTVYSLMLIGISIVCTLIFTPFCPKNKAECHEWRRLGDLRPSYWRPYLGFFLSFFVIIYGFVAAVLLLVPSTSCLPEVGGMGCL